MEVTENKAIKISPRAGIQAMEETKRGFTAKNKQPQNASLFDMPNFRKRINNAMRKRPK